MNFNKENGRIYCKTAHLMCLFFWLNFSACHSMITSMSWVVTFYSPFSLCHKDERKKQTLNRTPQSTRPSSKFSLSLCTFYSGFVAADKELSLISFHSLYKIKALTSFTAWDLQKKSEVESVRATQRVTFRTCALLWRFFVTLIKFNA